jgi:hypothetical protein
MQGDAEERVGSPVSPPVSKDIPPLALHFQN